MLGLIDVVKVFVVAQPGIQRSLGPHGIPLLAHARAGGEAAADTTAYLETHGDAGHYLGGWLTQVNDPNSLGTDLLR